MFAITQAKIERSVSYKLNSVITNWVRKRPETMRKKNTIWSLTIITDTDRGGRAIR